MNRRIFIYRFMEVDKYFMTESLYTSDYYLTETNSIEAASQAIDLLNGNDFEWIKELNNRD